MLITERVCSEADFELNSPDFAGPFWCSSVILGFPVLPRRSPGSYATPALGAEHGVGGNGISQQDPLV